tara:strand:- start:117 stop:359 length:243 start_codon:yes stop_codon:yes gene_type:complete
MISDREICIHTVTSLTGFFRRDESDPDPEMYKYLLETSRLALFSKISLEEMYKIVDECDKQDREIVKLTEKMVKYLETQK